MADHRNEQAGLRERPSNKRDKLLTQTLVRLRIDKLRTRLRRVQPSLEGAQHLMMRCDKVLVGPSLHPLEFVTGRACESWVTREDVSVFLHVRQVPEADLTREKIGCNVTRDVVALLQRLHRDHAQAIELNPRNQAR